MTTAALERTGRPSPLDRPIPPPAAWPRTAVVGSLTTLALVLAVLETVRPVWTPHLVPAALAGATLSVGALVLRHGRAQGPLVRATWRGFAGIVVLLALGQLVRAVTGAG